MNDNAQEAQELLAIAGRLRTLANALEAEADRLELLATPDGENLQPLDLDTLNDLDTSHIPAPDYSNIPPFDFSGVDLSELQEAGK